MSKYQFQAKVWRWTEAHGPATWFFVTLPEDVTDEIDDSLTGPPAGFGSVKVRVTVGDTTWETSLFPSDHHGSFILPIKKSVRASAGLSEGTQATFTLDVLA